LPLVKNTQLIAYARELERELPQSGESTQIQRVIAIIITHWMRKGKRPPAWRAVKMFRLNGTMIHPPAAKSEW